MNEWVAAVWLVALVAGEFWFLYSVTPALHSDKGYGDRDD